MKKLSLLLSCFLVLILLLSSSAFASGLTTDVEFDQTISLAECLVALGYDLSDDEGINYFLEWCFNLPDGLSISDMQRQLENSEFADYDIDLSYVAYQLAKVEYSADPAYIYSGYVGIEQSNGNITLYVIKGGGAGTGNNGTITTTVSFDSWLSNKGVLTTSDLATTNALITTTNSLIQQFYNGLLSVSDTDVMSTVIYWLAEIGRNTMTGHNNNFYINTESELASWSQNSTSSTKSNLYKGSLIDLVRRFNNSLIYQNESLNQILTEKLDSDLLTSEYNSFLGPSGSISDTGITMSKVSVADMIGYTNGSILGLSRYLDSKINSSVQVSSLGGVNSNGVGQSSYISTNASVADLLAYVNRGIYYLQRSNRVNTVGTYSLSGYPRFNFVSFDSDLERLESYQSNFTSINGALAFMFGNLQPTIAQLQAVLANDDDLELRRQTQEEVSSVTDNFTGKADAAPSTSDIGDMASVSTGITTAFDSGVSAGDFFTSLSDEDVYSFFSQETANDMDSTSSPAAMADSPGLVLPDGFVVDDSGYVTVQSVSVFDYLSRLGGE